MTTEPTQADNFYLDCEFDGHNGPLLSLALVRQDGHGIHIATTAEASDPWVVANVVPLIDKHDCKIAVRCPPHVVGAVIRTFIDCDSPTIIADSPVDIGRFCQALSTSQDGRWASADYPAMRFEVHNVDCYPTDLPGAIQHNAWWDAMALRHNLAHRIASTAALQARVETLEAALVEMIDYAAHSERWQDDHPEYVARAKAALGGHHD